MVSKREKSSTADKILAADASKVRDEYQSLCRELNMDAATSNSAWKSYEEIKQNYTLEGNQLHWLACSLFVACHNSHVPTVNKESKVEGNGISLTRLLRSCKLSLIQFFNKAKKWADMSNLKTQFREKIDSLEKNFVVSSVIFKKYQPIFVYLFKDPAKDPPKLLKSRKQKKPPCTPGEIFDFTWDLFVRVKTDFPGIPDDLVNSYHLLLSCIDYIYGNAIMAKRTDLLNDKFSEKLEQESAEDGKEKNNEPPCILDTLCRMYDGIISEVKCIKEHWWKEKIRQFFEQKTLRGDSDTLFGILEPAFFDSNAKNIRLEYGTYVLSIGEYDERVFLGEDANEEIGTPNKMATGPGGEAMNELNQRMVARRNLATQFDGSSLIPITPLSGKHYLQAKEQLKITPVSSATYLVSRLNALLRNREAAPSQKLKDLFASCDADPTESITKRVQDMGRKFCELYTPPIKNPPASYDSFTRIRLKMGIMLYYKLLEKILVKEKTQNKPLNNLLSQDIFHQALITCSLEIVIFSYNSQKTFPWILTTFAIEPIHFYKVIEIIIRAEDQLPRDVVKHLQRVEEQILDCRAWTHDSPLWDAIERDPQGVPSCEEVSLPGQNLPGSSVENFSGQSPLSHYKRHFQVLKSPMAEDRFKSPVVTAVARRQLAFGDNSNQIAPISPVKAGQSLLASPQKTFIQVIGQNIPNVKSIGNGKIVIQPSTVADDDSHPGNRPKRTGSLALFFRKVYHLAHLRLDALCQSLELLDEDVKRKTWTTLEYTLTKETELMKGRHLDQLIMCSLFIVCMTVDKKQSFLKIMEKYHSQPQAASHVYRSVLLSTKNESNRGEPQKKKKLDQNNPPPTPTRPAASSTIVDGEERGDLISFYNSVFRVQLREFVLKFRRQNEAPPLSPLPKLRSHPQSPCRKVSDSHSVYIRPLKSDPGEMVINNPQSPHKPLSYSFSRSPAKNLKAINDVMRAEVERKSRVGKRLLTDDATNSDGSVVKLAGGVGVHVNEADEAPAAKMRIIGQAAAVNAKLGLVLGDRTLND